MTRKTEEVSSNLSSISFYIFFYYNLCFVFLFIACENGRYNIELIHVFHALTFVVARGSCLNPRPHFVYGRNCLTSLPRSKPL